jgi:putative heme-binding domain-containing protein
LRDEGNEVGADLGSVATKPLDYLIASILDPNRSVEARYLSYTATMKDELEYTGIMVAETGNNVTLRQAGGKEVILLRSDLKELTGGTRSLMPDGFENNLSPQALADLISYIRGANPKN